MAWGQPKRNGKNVCGHRGQCGCQRRTKAQIVADTTDRPGNATCIRVCDRRTGKPCGQLARGGVCPCPYC